MNYQGCVCSSFLQEHNTHREEATVIHSGLTDHARHWTAGLFVMGGRGEQGAASVPSPPHTAYTRIR